LTESRQTAAKRIGNIITGNVTERSGAGAWMLTHSGSETAGDNVLSNNLFAGSGNNTFAF